MILVWKRFALKCTLVCFFKSPLQGIFLVYDITSERSFQHIMKWASDVDEVSHRDWGFHVNRDFFSSPLCRKGQNWHKCSLCRGLRWTKSRRCLTCCDKKLWLDGHCSAVFIISSFSNTILLLNVQEHFFPLAVTFFYQLWVFIKKFRPPCFRLSFPTWFHSINLVMMDLISSVGWSEYTQYIHTLILARFPFAFNLGLISWALCSLLTFEISLSLPISLILFLFLFLICKHPRSTLPRKSGRSSSETKQTRWTRGRWPQSKVSRWVWSQALCCYYFTIIIIRPIGLV